MLNQIAKKTTIHGVKDMWRANWIGRAFFLIVFACCITFVVSQLRGVFRDYISDVVGTRVLSMTKSGAVEDPSIYYCNKNWLPKVDALWHYKPVTNGNTTLFNTSYNKIYQECVHMARYNTSLDQLVFKDEIKREYIVEDLQQYMALAIDPKPYCKPYLEYWKSMIKEELVNAILQPLDDSSYVPIVQDSRLKRPELSLLTRTFVASILEDPIQKILNSELKNSLKVFVENSVLNLTLDDGGPNRGCKACTVKQRSSSAVMSPVLDKNEGEPPVKNLFFYLSHLFAQGYPLNMTYHVVDNYTLHPSTVLASLDGVCYEYPTSPQDNIENGANLQKIRHVVTHLGGLVHQLRILGRQSLSVRQSFGMVYNYVHAVGKKYSYTDVAVSDGKMLGLYFNQKLRVTTESRVNIKYWRKASVLLNRKTWPCRPAPWTDLDQAHCNQELFRRHQYKFFCQTYLPASESYAETPVTNNTCIYDRTYLFKDILSAIGNSTFSSSHSPIITRQLFSFHPSRVSYDYHNDVISRLTESNPSCPRPCSRTDFSYQVNYPAPTADDTRMCHMALAYWLTPNTLDYYVNNSYNPNLYFHGLYDILATSSQIHRSVASTPYCSVIEYEQLEARDHISEEYLLYGLPDVAANLGGTIGLWLGASVVSAVQLVYLCCLKRLFKRISRKYPLWRETQAGRNLNQKNWSRNVPLCLQSTMLTRIAHETTIHGVQDTWRANWIGRAFFLTIFSCCFPLILFQVKGLFHGFIAEVVGTRVIRATKSGKLDVPSFYYCNRKWVPHAEELWRLKDVISNHSFNKSYDQTYEECIHMAGYNRSLQQMLYPWSKSAADDLKYRVTVDEPKSYCKPFIDYWKSMIKQDVVNAIVQPLEDKRYDLYKLRGKRPELSVMTRTFAADILADHIQNLLNTTSDRSLRAFVTSSTMYTRIQGGGINKSCTACTMKHAVFGTVMSQLLADTTEDTENDENIDNFYFFMHTALFGTYSSYTDFYDTLSKSTLRPSAVSTSLDGICLEYASGPQVREAQEVVGRTHRHVVIHLGGMASQLQTLGHMLTQTDITNMENNQTDDISSVRHAVRTALNFANVIDDEYYTHVAVSKHNEPGLYFNQKVRTDSSTSLVNIKFWTTSSTHLNRKVWSCNSAPWSELDQAHCNQELSRFGGDNISCETYLPASKTFPENPIGINTCIYDHTGIFKDIITAMSDLDNVRIGRRGDYGGSLGGHAWMYTQSSDITRLLSSFKPSRVRYDYHNDVVSRLTESTRDCPRPCTRTVFSLQTSFPSPSRDDIRLCHMALAYWLTPETLIEGPSRELWKNAWFYSVERITKSTWLAVAQEVITRDFGHQTPYCSVIEYEQTESHGHISEQYLLYGLPDLAANVGGTLSLWVGASVMSFVQLVYLCCLKSQFRRIRRKVRKVYRKKRRAGKMRSIAPADNSNNQTYRPKGLFIAA